MKTNLFELAKAFSNLSGKIWQNKRVFGLAKTLTQNSIFITPF